VSLGGSLLTCMVEVLITSVRPKHRTICHDMYGMTFQCITRLCMVGYSVRLNLAVV